MITIQKDVSLKSFNTFGLEVAASDFATFSNIEELKEGLKLRINGQPLLILGGGSNILFTQDFDGLVLKNELKGIQLLKEDQEHLLVKVMAGEVWHDFVLHCIQNNWSGVENLSLIPGTVGAAPMQNIGAYGVEIQEVFHSLEAVEIATGKLVTFDKEKCEFGYRESIFKKSAKGKYIITSVTFQLNKKVILNTTYGAISDTLNEMEVTEINIKAVSDAVIKIRQSKLPDPAKIGNAGSFFKNPSIDRIDYEGLRSESPSIPGYKQPGDKLKVPAAWLIEKAGWKGKTIGNIGVHKNQPLVLVNYGGGDGAKIRDLAFEVKESVAHQFGIVLTPEVNII
jgi:UDP-N-acetylmuramate dehydrogenase